MELICNSFLELLESAEENVSGKDAFLWMTGTRIHKKTYGEFLYDVLSFAQGLKNLGLPDNSNVAVVGENSYNWIVVFFGAVIAGHVIVPLDKDMTPQEIEASLTEIRVSVLCYAAEYAADLKEISRPDNLKCFGLDSLPMENPKDVFKSGDNKRHSVTILTSGTTARRKGVMLTEETILSSATMARRAAPEAERIILCLPLHHIFALSMVVVQLLCRNTVAINASLRNLSRDMEAFTPDAIPFVPMHIEAFYKKALAAVGGDTGKLPQVLPKIFGGKLKIILAGGAYLDPKYVTEYVRCGIWLINCYGISECSPGISLGLQENCPPDSVGIPLSGCEVTIFDPDKDGVGEICVKGPQVMLGYFEQPEQTAEALIDGVYHTGDLGRLDKDGFLYVTGRKKFLIIASNGENISPEELELPILQLPYVQEGICYQEGDEIVAEVYFAPEALEDSGPEVLRTRFDKDLNAINSRKVSHKRINRFKVRETEFAKTTAKKIKRDSHM